MSKRHRASRRRPLQAAGPGTTPAPSLSSLPGGRSDARRVAAGDQYRRRLSRARHQCDKQLENPLISNLNTLLHSDGERRLGRPRPSFTSAIHLLCLMDF